MQKKKNVPGVVLCHQHRYGLQGELGLILALPSSQFLQLSVPQVFCKVREVVFAPHRGLYRVNQVKSQTVLFGRSKCQVWTVTVASSVAKVCRYSGHTFEWWAPFLSFCTLPDLFEVLIKNYQPWGCPCALSLPQGEDLFCFSSFLVSSIGNIKQTSLSVHTHIHRVSASC